MLALNQKTFIKVYGTGFFANMLTITKQSDYGLILIAFVKNKGRLVKLSELIEAHKITQKGFWLNCR